jgi:hypothetical protein
MSAVAHVTESTFATGTGNVFHHYMEATLTWSIEDMYEHYIACITYDTKT